MNWKRPHQSAQQKRRAQDPTTRKLNTAAQLAPSVPLPPARCAGCSCPQLIHPEGGPCMRNGCDCPGWS